MAKTTTREGGDLKASLQDVVNAASKMIKRNADVAKIQDLIAKEETIRIHVDTDSS